MGVGRGQIMGVGVGRGQIMGVGVGRGQIAVLRRLECSTGYSVSVCYKHAVTV